MCGALAHVRFVPKADVGLSCIFARLATRKKETVESPQYSLNPGCGIVALLVYPSHALRAYTPFSTLDKRLTESVVRRGRTH